MAQSSEVWHIAPPLEEGVYRVLVKEPGSLPRVAFSRWVESMGWCKPQENVEVLNDSPLPFELMAIYPWQPITEDTK